MEVLELKLSILVQGPGSTRRNPALDVLTGRVPDERVVSLRAGLSSGRTLTLVEGALEDMTQTAPTPSGPTAMVLPVAAIRMAAVARSSRPASSPWVSASDDARPRLRLISPPISRWNRIPWLGGLLAWLRAEFRPYKSQARNPRAHPAS
jgi:hypothetical protein